jgi:hypothetical protein
MVDAQHASVPHVGAQCRDERREAAPPQRERVDRRQAPVLPRPAQRIGRRADRRARRHQFLVGPGIRAVRNDPDRKVAVEPDREPGDAARLRRNANLPVGFPLQELEELDAVAMLGGEGSDFRRARIAHRGRPVAP